MKDKLDILVAEDDVGMQRMYRMLLPEYKLHVFDNGRDAGNFYQARRDGLDLVITDYSMPGLSGDKLIQFIRAYDRLFHRSRMPVLLCNGDSVFDFSSVDCDRVLYKPFDLDVFDRTIDGLLGKEEKR